MRKIYDCSTCGYKWMSRKDTRPRSCPKCQSTNWDRSKPERNNFNFGILEVGQELMFEWPDGVNKRHCLIMALNSYASRTKKKFSHVTMYSGLLIKRLI